jgi:small subunit ribosomal protein S2
MRAIQLYAAGIADAVLEGKSSIPEVPTGDDEFVELDEEGKPKVGEQKAPPKKAPGKKRGRVTKIRSKGRRPGGEDGAAEGGEEAPAAEGESEEAE